MNRIQILPVAAIAAIALLAPMSAESANECFFTTQSMKQSCRFEGIEDYWSSRADCLNDTSATFSSCLVEAGADLRDLWDECDEVADGRDAVCEALPDQGPYDPLIDPDDFVSAQEASANPNPFFPLVIGRSYLYEAEDETILVTITDDTREILGVETTAVRDTVTDEEGDLIEDTIDWYAQDIHGNVWYFGEIAQNFEDGVLVDVEGSFTAGVDKAKPGIIMFASPQVGRTYRQEWALGEAEDVAKILSLSGDDSVPAADCNGACLVTLDFNPLEPGPVENKYYVAGVGLVLEIDPSDGSRVELVEVSDE